jgi:hypothetical protein
MNEIERKQAGLDRTRVLLSQLRDVADLWPRRHELGRSGPINTAAISGYVLRAEGGSYDIRLIGGGGLVITVVDARRYDAIAVGRLMEALVPIDADGRITGPAIEVLDVDRPTWKRAASDQAIEQLVAELRVVAQRRRRFWALVGVTVLCLLAMAYNVLAG